MFRSRVLHGSTELDEAAAGEFIARQWPDNIAFMCLAWDISDVIQPAQPAELLAASFPAPEVALQHPPPPLLPSNFHANSP